MYNDICIVQNSLKTLYGFRVNYIKKLLEKGINVSVIAPIDCDESYNELKKIGVNIIEIPRYGSFFSKIKLILCMNYAIFTYARTKIIIVHFISTFYISLPALFFVKKVVVSIEGIGSLLLRYQILRKISKLALSRRNFKRLFCNEDERDLLGCEGDKVTGGIGINLLEFNGLDIEKTDGFNMIYVGRLIKDKGILDAIEVLRLLLSKGSDFRLTIVGDIYPNNPSSINVESKRQFEREFGDKIVFLGHVKDVSNYINQSDALILPSRREGFPVCVMEASACGVPSICYDVPGCRDAVKENINGWLIKPFSIPDMAETLYKYHCLNNSSNMKVTCRELAELAFDVDSKSEAFISEVYS
ncbi:glycosyltransferase [Vibrio breoganii]